MNAVFKNQQEIRDGLALLGLQALASYAMSGLAKPGEHMHEEIARRLALKISRNRGKK